MLYYLRGDEHLMITEVEGLGDLHRQIMETYRKGKVDEALSLISDEVLHRFVFLGSTEDVRKKLAEYQRLGLELFTIRSVIDQKTGVQTVMKNLDTAAALQTPVGTW